jgi:hypothetical protein
LDLFMETPETPHTDIEPEALPDLPVPTDIKAVFQGGLFFLALLAACYLVLRLNQMVHNARRGSRAIPPLAPRMLATG